MVTKTGATLYHQECALVTVISECMVYGIQWSLSIADILETAKNVHISEVSGVVCAQLYLAVTLESVLIKEVSLFQRFHCKYSYNSAAVNTLHSQKIWCSGSLEIPLV